MREMLANLFNGFRDLSHELHPRNLDTLSLATNLQTLIREVAFHSGLQIEFQEQSVPHSMPMPTVICLYRIAQESLSNIRKHADAATIAVKLVGAPGELRLLISDDGVGLEHDRTEQAHDGIGLTRMEERIRLLGGHVSIMSRPGEGTTITAVIPLSS
jgi:signal transduction histidine kinase